MQVVHPPQRAAGRLAIASGVLGILAFASLLVPVVGRILGLRRATVTLLFKTHDIGVAIQALLMIPVVLVLYALMRELSPARGRSTLALGLAGNVGLALCVSLIFLTQASNMVYMLPQGLVGIWLILIGRQLAGTFTRRLNRTGTIAGLGLVIVAVSLLAIALALGPGILALRGPIPPTPDPNLSNVANWIAHITLAVGTFMGVLLYPIWSILLGRKLLRAGG